MTKRSTVIRFCTESRDGGKRRDSFSGMDLRDAKRSLVADAVTSRYRGKISGAWLSVSDQEK